MPTRILQTGWEFNSIYETPDVIGADIGTVPITSNSFSNTGTYSLRYFPAGTYKASVGKKWPDTDILKVSSNVFLRHLGVSDTADDRYSVIFRWSSDASVGNFVGVEQYGDVLDLVVDGTTQDSITWSTSPIGPTATWYSLGIVIFADPVNGEVHFYADGSEILSATGINTGNYIVGVYVGGAINRVAPLTGAAAGWSSSAYFDDFYIDDITGEGTAAPSPKRFDMLTPNANGSFSDWTGTDGDSVNNYAHVDERPHDSETTEVHSTVDGEQDTYNFPSATVPPGYQILAAIPTAAVRRAGITEQIRMLAYDGGTLATGSAKNLPSGFQYVWDRMTTQPDATDWNETDLNAMEFGYESEIP